MTSFILPRAGTTPVVSSRTPSQREETSVGNTSPERRPRTPTNLPIRDNQQTSTPKGDDKGTSQGQQQQQGGEGKEYGEGNYKAARQYNEGLKEHVQHHDIEKEARAAAPRSEAEAKEMEEAERIAKSRARGEDKSSGDQETGGT